MLSLYSQSFCREIFESFTTLRGLLWQLSGWFNPLLMSAFSSSPVAEQTLTPVITPSWAFNCDAFNALVDFFSCKTSWFNLWYLFKWLVIFSEILSRKIFTIKIISSTGGLWIYCNVLIVCLTLDFGNGPLGSPAIAPSPGDIASGLWGSKFAS